MGRDYDMSRKIYEEMDSVDLANLSAFQQQYFADKAFNYCVVASKEKVSMKDLKKIGKVKELSLEEIFGY